MIGKCCELVKLGICY